MCLAIPGRIEAISDDRDVRMGRVNFDGVVKEVCLAYVPDAAVGDYAIVHVGFAIALVDEASAKQTLATFDEIAHLATDPTSAPATRQPLRRNSPP